MGIKISLIRENIKMLLLIGSGEKMGNQKYVEARVK